MKIFGWAADTFGCGYYRVGLPMAALADRGHRTYASTLLTDEWRDADVIVGQRVCLEGPSTTWQKLAADDRACVYELDDNLLEVDPSSRAAWAMYSQPEVRARIENNIRCASWVTVSTAPLADVIRRYNPRVVVVPNAVPDWLLEHRRPVRDRITIGWAGSATHRMDLEEIAAPLRQVIRRHPNIDLHLIGADYRQLLRVPEDRVRYTPWCRDIETYYRKIDFDIALAPLRPHVFNQSKSDIRIVEMAALGIPVIASDVGPYSTAVQDGVTGILCRQPHQWARAIRELVNDPAKRADLAANARRWVAGRTITATAPLWEQALTGDLW